VPVSETPKQHIQAKKGDLINFAKQVEHTPAQEVKYLAERLIILEREKGKLEFDRIILTVIVSVNFLGSFILNDNVKKPLVISIRPYIKHIIFIFIY
jgi:hypothetical protein